MKPPRILICDDDYGYSKIYGELLEKEWFDHTDQHTNVKVVTRIVESDAKDSELRLDEIAAYDLIMLDIVWLIEDTPGQSREERIGVDIAKLIRNAYPEMPIVIFSQRVTVDDFHELLKLEINGFLSKDAPMNAWVVEIDRVWRTSNETQVGQALYKHLRELRNTGAWEAELINEAASAVWKEESARAKWDAFWDVFRSKVAVNKLLAPVISMANSFKDFDLITLGTIPLMRGHLEHVLQVYFTGYVISHRVPSFKSLVLDACQNLLGKKFAGANPDDLWGLFQVAWLTSATLHDAGYAYEIMPDIGARIAKLVNSAVLTYPSPEASSWKPLKREWSGTAATPVQEFVRNAFSTTIGKLHDGVFVGTWPLDNYVFQNSAGQDRINHGVLSGIMFLEKVHAELTILKSDPYLLEFLKWSATSMAFHSLKRPGATQKKGIRLKNDPLGFLLMICDEFQVWNRERPDATPSTSGYRLIDLEKLEFMGDQLEAHVKCYPYRGVPLSHAVHIEPLLHQLDETIKILTEYLQSAPMQVSITYHVSGSAEQFPVIKIT